MTQMLQMPLVQQCTVTRCGYNHGGCRAFAITVGGTNDSSCDTFIATQDKGGLDTVTAQVGACKRTDCRHNSGLACHAPQIQVGQNQNGADCMTYRAR
ncbi:DUF1540 domain-containing protein [Rugosimonospora africana]|uniref:DUF1540 domain-containing protein n=1 Tax=Rugosimonospora africana TaxID=556532 RepID=A0A8J3QTP2_9ACTN|nr:DUF1540 domain-containing protein [Rugosimonospora africana]GIH15620.1 hypothetical protein Raf01_37920 [Rugosimonospora africana]